MALSIKNPEVERLARELAAKTGESITDAVLLSLRERLVRQDARRVSRRLDRVVRLAQELSKYRVDDPRTDDEILGYDEHGLPT